jgi:hypothetical protein
MNELWPVDPRETSLDAQCTSLIENIRSSLMIQAEMLRRILDTKPKPSLLLAELLEDAGNRYLDFSELVCVAASTHRESASLGRVSAWRAGPSSPGPDDSARTPFIRRGPRLV